MSRAMMARRLIGAGLRRPAPSPAMAASAPSPCTAAGLMAHMEGLSLQNQQHRASIGSVPSHSRSQWFSSIPPQRAADCKILELPPNLKFDPRAVSTPFHGAERVESERARRRRERKGKAKQLEAGSTAATDAEESPEGEKSSDGVAEAKAEALESVEGGAEEEYIGEYDDEYDSEDEEEERILYDLSTMPDVPRAIPLPQRLHVPVMDFKTGEEVGTFHLSERTFGNDPVRVDILHRVVVWQRNRKRGKRNAGARTKRIAEISGSGRKVRPQKGQGKARAGHSRPAHWRGGAKAHGPRGNVQDYTTKLNKKVRKMGVRHALSQKLLEGNLVVTSGFAVPTHKTKDLDAMLQRFGISGKDGCNALVIDDADPADAEGGEGSVYGGLDVNFKVASSNLQKVKVLNQLGCNVYDMMKFRKLVVSLAAVRSLEERLERDL